MKPEAGRLSLLSRVFAQREQQIAQRLAQLGQQLAHARAQLEELRGYHTTRPAARLVTDQGRMGNAQAFDDRLADAIRRQQADIDRLAAARAEVNRQWLAQRQKTRSVESLLERRRTAAQREGLRTEQKQLDELASRRHLDNER